LVAINLVINPVLIWLILSALGDFEPTWTYAAIIMAALPPALNIFVLSTQYGTGAERASACVLLGTLGSTVTLTAFLWLIRTGRMPADLAPPL
jgi:predicted permease